QAFKVMPGKGKGDVATQIKSLGARELGPGAIVFRSGEKLYIVDGVAAVVQEGRAEPSYMRDPAYGPRRDVLINNPNWQPPSYMRDPAYAQRRVPTYDEPEYMRFQNRDVNYMRDPAYAQRRVPDPEYMRFQDRDVNYMRDPAYAQRR